jgi:hypothetical protein
MFKTKGVGVEVPNMMDISCLLFFFPPQIILGGYLFVSWGK